MTALVVLAFLAMVSFYTGLPFYAAQIIRRIREGV